MPVSAAVTGPVTGPPVRRVGLVSSVLAPILLIGGWTVAAARQPVYDSFAETISALAALDAMDRWLMTVALAGLGVCHAVTAWALRAARAAGRAVLAIGGVATVGVAAFPLPTGDGASAAHEAAAVVAFGAMAVWPALAWRRRSSVAALRPVPALVAAAVLLALAAWFALARGSDLVGLAERAAAGAQALWPLATVLSAVQARRWVSRNATVRRIAGR